VVDDRDAQPQEPPSADDFADAGEVAVEDRHRRLRIAVVLTLVAAIVVFGAVGGRIVTSRETPAPSPRLPARIAVIGSNGSLATMDGHGGSSVTYSAPDVAFSFPTWSPDGTRIAALGNTGSESAVYVFAARADGTAAAPEPAVLYRSAGAPPFYLYWAPDSQKVAFLAQEADAISLQVAPADASAKPAIVRRGAPLYWEWVDPSRVIAHVGLDGSDAFLGEVGLDGTATEPKGLTPGLFRAPAIGGDGAIRAYVGSSADGLDQVVVESRDQKSHHEVSVFGFAALNFDPAGRTLAFVAADRPGMNTSGLPIGPLRVVDPGTGEARTVLDGRVLAFFWAPDGKTIAALRIPDPGDGVASDGSNATLAVARRGPAATAPPPHAEGIDLNLAFVDVASGKARSARSVHLAQTFVYQLLPYFDQYALSHRVWAPDSSSIALPLASDSAATGIFSIPSDGSEPQRIADGELGFWSP